MTTLDHPDLILSDRREHIMQAVRDVITADTERAKRNHEHAANAAIEAALPHISRFLESYGADPTTGIVTGPCTDPDHALAWAVTAAGFSFEMVLSRRFGDTECWLLHPLTGERVYRIDGQATWEHAARAIHAADQATEDIGDEDHPPAEHPADVLVTALRYFIEAVGSHHDRAF